MKTILNKKKISGKQPLFLGEDLSIQRYDKCKYPVFFDLFKTQLSFFWRPEEITLTKDRNDYEILSPNEKFIFTSNLKYQTMMDSVICRGVPLLQQYVSNPELEACLNVWQFFEQIHSYSYTYIIKNVYSSPSEVFDTILEDEEIIKRAEAASTYYDRLLEPSGDIKQDIYLTLISINILEALRFYVSFVCAFSFAEAKKMIGNADIVRQIKRDENVHVKTTCEIIKILQTKEDEGFIKTAKKCEKQAIKMFAEAVEEEKAWARYLFTDGSVIGLSEDILCQYIEWLASGRMKALGLEPLFSTKNPINWVTPWMESSTVQVAPQESEITSYLIGDSLNDLDDMKLDIQL